MPVNIKKSTKAAVKSSTSVQHSKTGAEVVKESIEQLASVPPVYANVGVTAARTINLGEYNSVKLGVSIYHPCAPTKDAIERTYEFCVGWVDTKMQALTSEHDSKGEGEDAS